MNTFPRPLLLLLSLAAAAAVSLLAANTADANDKKDSCQKNNVVVTGLTNPVISDIKESSVKAATTATASREGCNYSVRIVVQTADGKRVSESGWKRSSAKTSEISQSLSKLKIGVDYRARAEWRQDVKPKKGKPKTGASGWTTFRTYKEAKIKVDPELISSIPLIEDEIPAGAILTGSNGEIEGSNVAIIPGSERIEPIGEILIGQTPVTKPSTRYRYCYDFTDTAPDGTQSQQAACSDWVRSGDKASPPSVSRPEVEGDTLVAEARFRDCAAYSDECPSAVYSWWRQTKTGKEVDTGVTGPVYPLSPADNEARVYVKVSFTNLWGFASDQRKSSSVTVKAPQISNPSIDLGDTGSGLITTPELSRPAEDLIRYSSGVPDPSSIVIQWQACSRTKTSSCRNVEGRTEDIFGAIDGSQVKKYLRVSITATNVIGTTTVYSRLTRQMTAVDIGGIVNESEPSVRGTARVGRTLSASEGRWDGDTDLLVQWLRCKGSSCTKVAEGETRYTLTAADRGHTIRIEVVASNDLTTKTVRSAASSVVKS